ncbi:hypothetical protein MTR67_019654, partial [Solanum verrucosum]
VISDSAPRCFDDLLTSVGTWSSAEYARPVSICCTAVKAVCVRKLVELQSTSPIRSDEDVCTLDNNYSCPIYSTYKTTKRLFIQRETFQASKNSRDLIDCFKCFLYQLLLCLLVIMFIL